MAEKQQFMVDFRLPEDFNEEFTSLIDEQRAAVVKLFSKEKLASYTLSLEGGRLWAVVNAATEREAMQIVGTLPLTKYMKARIYPLTFHNTVNKLYASFSLN